MADLTMSPSEQQAILDNPRGVMLLMDYHDFQQAQADAMDAGCHGNQKRYDELKAYGRALVEREPDAHDEEVLTTFGVPDPWKRAEKRKAASGVSPATPEDPKP